MRTLLPLLAHLLPHLPTRIGHTLALIAGFLTYLLAGKQRRQAMRNTVRVLRTNDMLGTRALRRAVRGQFRNQALNYWDAFRLPAWSDARLRRATTVVGYEHYLAARAKGRGVILASGHVGSVEYVAQVCRALGVPFTVPVEVVEPPELHELLTRLRTAHGTRIIPVSGPEVVGLYRSLRRNEAVGLVIDRFQGGEGAGVPFFGRPAAFPVGAAALARRTGAALLPAYTRRIGLDRYLVICEGPVSIERGGSARAAAEAGTARLVDRLARWIAAHPSLWAAFNPVWGGRGDEHEPGRPAAV